MNKTVNFFLSGSRGAKARLRRCFVLLFFVIFGISSVHIFSLDTLASEFQVMNFDVHFRAEPGMDAEIYGGLPAGYIFPYEGMEQDEEGGWWYKVTYEDKSGYVSADLVEEVTPSEEEILIGEDPEETEITTVEETATQDSPEIPDDPETEQEETLPVQETESPEQEVEPQEAQEQTEPEAEDETAEEEIEVEDEEIELLDRNPQPSWSGIVQSEEAFQAQLSRFPESYKPGITALHALYPNYTFTADYVGMDFQEVVDAETQKKVSAYSADSLKAMYDSSFGRYENYNWETGEWYNSEGMFTYASREVIEYYMDPRNFLDADGIYMFMRQSFTEDQTLDGLRSIIQGSFLSQGYAPNPDEPNDVRLKGDYAAVIMEAARNAGISPYVLAASILAEHGYTGETPLISGYFKARDGTVYKNYFNFYDIGATGTDSNNVIQNGLEYAKAQGWTSRYLSIVNGALWTVDSYISNGQDTYYYKDYNVINGWDSLWHQFSTAVMGAYGSQSLIRGTLQWNTYAALDFRIPVYENMPQTPASEPQSSDKVNNYYFTSMAGTGLEPAFSMANRNYTMTVTGDTTLSITVPKWAAYESPGSFSLNAGENKVELNVRSQTGYLRTYSIAVTAVKNCTLHVDTEAGNRLTISDTVTWGDANGDGKVSSLDYIAVKNHIMGVKWISGDVALANADANGDGRISTLDYIAIKNYIMAK